MNAVRTAALAATGMVVALGLTVVPAHAKSVDVQGAASCTGGVKAKIKAGPRDPRQLKINVQVDDTGTTARTWTIVVRDNDESRTVTATTAGASNSIDRDVFTANGAGADTVTFTATRAGASCSGSVVVP
ncbi:hypothetical protein [Kineosporia sp. A_224]|uniref:hypothetical protein n=1 Tax=Kineosporia sp. A_224 TaxID=1962180 RepID=UPI00117A538C|nr:hypothetical protein [Kineosporia sp. A_224]